MVLHGQPLAHAGLLASLLGFASFATAQTRADCERAYTPQRGQEGRDVIWVPTEDSMLGPLFELANVTAADTVYDLGSGDGKIVIAAAKRFGATGVGIEYDADLVAHARCLAAAERVADRVTFVQGDIFETDFSAATVVALYLTPQVNLRLVPLLLALTPGTRIVAYSFGIGEWEPESQVDSFGDGSVFLFVVPANVNGAWTFRPAAGGEGFTAELEQTFQQVRGTARGAAVTGKLRGAALEVTFGHGAATTRLTGTVGADHIVATVVQDGAAAEYVGMRR